MVKGALTAVEAESGKSTKLTRTEEDPVRDSTNSFDVKWNGGIVRLLT